MSIYNSKLWYNAIHFHTRGNYLHNWVTDHFFASGNKLRSITAQNDPHIAHALINSYTWFYTDTRNLLDKTREISRAHCSCSWGSPQAAKTDVTLLTSWAKLGNLPRRPPAQQPLAQTPTAGGPLQQEEKHHMVFTPSTATSTQQHQTHTSFSLLGNTNP